MATIEGHNSSASSALTNTVSVPGTPQAGDKIIIIGQALYTGDGINTMSIQSDPGFTKHFAVTGDRIRSGWSKDWESGDPTSLTIEITASFGTPAVKFQFAAIWLVRPTAGGSIQHIGDGGPSGAGDSTLTSTTTIVDANSDPLTVNSGDILTIGHVEDDQDVVYSSFDHDTFSLTIDSTFNEGSGGATNWTGAGYASGITTASHTDVSATNDASANDWSMVAMAFEEVTAQDLVKVENEVVDISETDIKLVEPEAILPTSGSGWGIPIGI